MPGGEFGLMDFRELQRQTRDLTVGEMRMFLTQADTNNAPQQTIISRNGPRRGSVRVQSVDGRVFMQDFDFESEPTVKKEDLTPKRTVGEIMTDRDFIEACIAGKVEPTRRQASKFRKKQGTAWAAFEALRLRMLNAPCAPVLEGRAPRPRDDEEV